MYYRILDDYNEPYSFCYNSKSLKDIARWIYLFEKEFFDENEYDDKKIYSELKRWIYDIWWYNVEKSEKPFNKKELEQSFNF
jgi:hypothetical protein